MKKKVIIYYMMSCLLVCASCEKDVDLSGLSGKGKIFVSAFVGTPESGTIRIAKTIPTAVHDETAPGGNVDVTFRVNGADVEPMPDESLKAGKGEYVYRVDAALKPGDKMEILCSSEGYDGVYAQSCVPAFPKIMECSAESVTAVIKNGIDDFYEEEAVRLVLDIADDPDTDDWYGVQVLVPAFIIEGVPSDELSCADFVGRREAAELDIPLPYVFAEDFYGGVMAAMDDSASKDGKLHLDLKLYVSSEKLKVAVWKLSREAYKSIESGAFANCSGIAILDAFRPGLATYSNVQGGLGVFGGVSKTESEFILVASPGDSDVIQQGGEGAYR